MFLCAFDCTFTAALVRDTNTVVHVPRGLVFDGDVVCILMGETAGLCDVRLLAFFDNGELE